MKGGLIDQASTKWKRLHNIRVLSLCFTSAFFLTSVCFDLVYVRFTKVVLSPTDTWDIQGCGFARIMDFLYTPPNPLPTPLDIHARTFKAVKSVFEQPTVLMVCIPFVTPTGQGNVPLARQVGRQVLGRHRAMFVRPVCQVGGPTGATSTYTHSIINFMHGLTGSRYYFDDEFHRSCPPG